MYRALDYLTPDKYQAMVDTFNLLYTLYNSMLKGSKTKLWAEIRIDDYSEKWALKREQLRLGIYTALAHGVKGIVFDRFAGSDNNPYPGGIVNGTYDYKPYALNKDSLFAISIDADEYSIDSRTNNYIEFVRVMDEIRSVLGVYAHLKWKKAYKIDNLSVSTTIEDIRAILTNGKKAKYIEIVEFEDTTSTKYFMVVNRHVSRVLEDTVYATIYLKKAYIDEDSSKWVLCLNDLKKIKIVDSVPYFSDTLNPGEGRLYRLMMR